MSQEANAFPDFEEPSNHDVFLQNALSSTADCLKILDLEGHILWISENGRKLMEISDFSQVQNREWTNFLSEGPDLQLMQKALQDGKNGQTGRFRGFCPTLAGTPKWWDVVVTPVFGNDGTPVWLLSVSRDITASLQAEHELEQARLRLDATLGSADIGTWTWDIPANLVNADKNLARLFSIPSGRGPLENFVRSIHPDDRVLVENKIKEALQSKTGLFETDYRLLLADGAIRWVTARGKVQFDAEGRPVQFPGVIIDITDRKKQEQAILELTQKMEAQTRLFDATLSSIADLAYTFDREARVIYANKPLLTLWGRSIEEVVGKNCFDLNYPDELARRLNGELLQVIDTGKSVRGETSFTSAAGSVDYHEYIFNPVFAADGSVVAVAGTTRLITDRKAREKAFQEQTNIIALRAAISSDLNRNDSPREVLQRCALSLSRHLDKSQVDIWTLDESHQFANRQGCAGLCASAEDPPSVLKISELNFLKIIKTRKASVKNDLGDTSSAETRQAREQGMQALASYPLFIENKVLGIVSIYSRQPFSQEILQEFEPLVASIAQWYQRTCTEEIVRKSAEQLRLAMSAADLGDWQWDPDSDITVLSGRASQIFGIPQGRDWTREELRELIVPEDRAMALNAARTASLGGHDYDVEYRIRRPDGTQRWVAAKGRNLYRDRKLISMLGVVQDITERKKAEEANQYLAALVESSEDAIISKDLDGVVTSWNIGAEHLFGYKAEEVVGKSVTLLMPPTELREEPLILERIRLGDRIEHFETVRRHKDGRLLEVSLTVSPIKDANNRIIGASKIARNITELKQAQRQLQEHAQDLEERVEKRTAELKETNSQLETLVYSIAHDLRAPLRSMQAYAKTLLEDYSPALDETAQHYAKRIVHSSETMDALVLDLLAYGRIARSQMELGPISLETIWRSALEQYEKDIEEKQARIEISLPLPLVIANEVTLGQVLANLLGNAIKFVAPGTIPLIRFHAERHENKVRIWVEDNGIGIAPEYHERIFRVFERLQGKTYPGTGIGLSIVRKGIERMGGESGVESEPGKGSRFWIELPEVLP